MKYNFDKVIDRSGTSAEKVEGLKHIWGRTDLIPLWVADMDFATAHGRTGCTVWIWMLFVNKLKVVSSLFYVILIIRVALCGLKQSYER